MIYRLLFTVATLLFSLNVFAAGPAGELDEDVELPDPQPSLGKWVGAGLEGGFYNNASPVKFDYQGMMAAAYGKYSFTPAWTAVGRGGRESFWQGKVSKAGFMAGASLHYAWRPSIAFSADLNYHGVLHDPFEGGVFAHWKEGSRVWRFGFERQLVEDSFVSLIGVQAAGAPWIGAARRKVLTAEMKAGSGANQLHLKGAFGVISSRGASDNRIASAEADFTHGFSSSKDGEWFLGSKTRLLGYQFDHSSLVYRARMDDTGGYFSPSFLAGETLALGYRGRVEGGGWSVSAGPSVHYATGSSIANGTKAGGTARLLTDRPLENQFHLKLEAQVVHVADLWTRVQAFAWLSRDF